MFGKTEHSAHAVFKDFDGELTGLAGLIPGLFYGLGNCWGLLKHRLHSLEPFFRLRILRRTRPG